MGCVAVRARKEEPFANLSSRRVFPTILARQASGRETPGWQQAQVPGLRGRVVAGQDQQPP